MYSSTSQPLYKAIYLPGFLAFLFGKQNKLGSLGTRLAIAIIIDILNILVLHFCLRTLLQAHTHTENNLSL